MARKFHGKIMRARGDAMVKEDYSKQCNLPTENIQKEWPGCGDNGMGYVDTLFEGVQKQLRSDNSMMRSIKKPAKY